MFHKQADTVEEAGRLRVVGRAGGGAAEPTPTRPALGTMLIEEGLVTSEQIKEAVTEGTETSERLGEVLLRQGTVDEAELARVIATQWKFPFIPDDQVEPDPQAAFLISPDEGRRLGAIPFGFEAGQAIVAIADPTDERIAAIHSLLGSAVKFVVVTQSAFGRLISSGSSERYAEKPALRTVASSEEPSVEAQAVVEPELADEAWAPTEEVIEVVATTEDIVPSPAPSATEPKEGDPAPVLDVTEPVFTAVPEQAPSGQVSPLVRELEDASRTLGVLPALFEQAAAELRNDAERLAATVHTLSEAERKLAESERTRGDFERKLTESEQELVAEREARRLEQTRVVELESEVANRDELLAAVRTKLSDLSGTLSPS